MIEQKEFIKSLNDSKSKKQHLVVLFEILRSFPEYNDVKAATFLRKKTGIKGYRKVENDLYDELRIFIIARGELIAVKNEIIKHFYLADNFFAKGLYDICEEELEKGETLMLQTEIFDQLDLYSKIKLSLSRVGYYSIETGISDFCTVTGIFKKNENLKQYVELEIQAEFIKMEDPGTDPKKHFQNIINNPLLSKSSKALLVTSKIIFNHIYCLYAEFINDKQLLEKHLKAIVDIFEHYPRYKKYHLSEYKKHLLNLCNVYLLIKNEEAYDKVAPKLMDALATPNTDLVKIMHYNHQFILCRYANNFKKGVNTITHNGSYILKYAKLLTTSNQMYLHLNIIICAFGCQEWEMMSKHMDLLEEVMKHNSLTKHKMLLRVIDLIKLYEKNALEACRSKMRSIQRYLKLEESSPTLRLVISAINSSLILQKNEADPSQVNQVFSELKQQLTSENKTNELEEFPFIRWAKAKEKGVKIMDLSLAKY